MVLMLVVLEVVRVEQSHNAESRVRGLSGVKDSSPETEFNTLVVGVNEV